MLRVTGRSFFLVLASALFTASFAGCSPSTDASLPDGMTVADLPIVMAEPLTGTFDQAVDHKSDAGTFKQRYWYSTQFVSGPHAPVIFYFCGEAPCSAKYAQSMADVAKSLGAAVVALEHRYYGQSLPFAKPTLDDFKYLTIANALEDAASFIAYAKQNLLLPSGKWLAVGGSYPGMLAAFMREKHPELIAGAWASSAPVNMQLSFAGYDMTVTRALGPACSQLFRQATAAAAALYDAGKGDETLKQIMGKSYEPAFSKADYMSDVASAAMGAAQYGKQFAFCAALSQYSADPLQGLIAYVTPPLDPALGDGAESATSKTVVAADPEVTLASFGRPFGQHADGDAADEIDAWIYQVCTEVGFYQVHNPQSSDSIMSPLVNEDYGNAYCDKIIHRRPDVATANATYYQPLAKGEVTNVLFVNGELDPWSVLSFVDKETLPAGLTSYVVAQGSHCTDLHNLDQNSLLGDFEAHLLFHKLATQWLAE